MPDHSLYAVYMGFKNRLTGTGSEVWGQRVAASLIVSKSAYPYTIYFWSGGGAWNVSTSRDADYNISVKCVADKMSDAAIGAERISVLLDNKGRQDDGDDFVYGSSDWDILTITEMEHIYFVEGTADTVPIYHYGAVYAVKMQHT